MHRDVAHRVEEERPAEAHGDHEEAGQGRAEDPGAGHDGAVEADRVGDVGPRHHLDDEGPSGRVVEGGDDALHGGERVDDADRVVVREDHGRQREGLGHRGGLGDDQQAPLVAAVGHGAGPGAEHEHGAELAGGEQAEGDAGIGQAQHEQGLGDHRQPRAGLGDRAGRGRRAGSCASAASGRCPSRRATRGSRGALPGVVAERLEDVERVEQPALLVRSEVGQAGLEPRGADADDLLEVPAAGGGAAARG